MATPLIASIRLGHLTHAVASLETLDLQTDSWDAKSCVKEKWKERKGKGKYMRFGPGWKRPDGGPRTLHGPTRQSGRRLNREGPIFQAYIEVLKLEVGHKEERLLMR